MVQGYLLLVVYPRPYFFLIEVFSKPQIRGFENTSNR
jgi:hypothetical protein